MLAVYLFGRGHPDSGYRPRRTGGFFAQVEGTIFGLFNLFSGGALEQFSVFSLGIMPYISASIILQLLTVFSPTWSACRKKATSDARR